MWLNLISSGHRYLSGVRVGVILKTYTKNTFAKRCRITFQKNANHFEWNNQHNLGVSMII